LSFPKPPLTFAASLSQTTHFLGKAHEHWICCRRKSPTF
jgi:hypothetical protein